MLAPFFALQFTIEQFISAINGIRTIKIIIENNITNTNPTKESETTFLK